MPRPVSNPPNPWTSVHVDWIGAPPTVDVQVFEEDAKTILATNDSPDVPFRYGVNPYRGCQHACAYCYARPGHEYLGFGAGTDFDAKIVVKRNAPELLERALTRRGWKRDWIAMSGVTDPYQPLEASYGLTRRCLEVCLRRENPVGLITKSALVRRDVELLARLHARAGAMVHLSIPFLDEDRARAIEPWAPSPRLRFETIRVLSDAGVPVGVSVSPLIPGLNDDEVPGILERAAAAGATSAFMILLRLPGAVRPVFEERLRAAFPDRANRVLHAIEDCRVGMDGAERASFGGRMHGRGARWETVRALFDVTCRRLGLTTHERDPVRDLSPRTAPRARQGDLFS